MNKNISEKYSLKWIKDKVRLNYAMHLFFSYSYGGIPNLIKILTK
jgi:hypothetical protein